MEHPSESTNKEYYCCFHKVQLAKNEIVGHLKLKSIHSIRKITPPAQTSEDLKILILNKITSLSKFQLEIQESSNKLIQSIIENTCNTLLKLSEITKLYKTIMQNPSSNQVKCLKKFKIIKTFEAKSIIYNTINENFHQYNVITEKKKIKEQVINFFSNHAKTMKCMAVFSDEKKGVTGGADGAIRIWNFENMTQTGFILKHKDVVNSLVLGKNDEILLSGSDDTTVRLWNVESGLKIHKFTGHTLSVTSVLLSSDSSAGYSGSLDMTIIIWDLKEFEGKRTISFDTPIHQICLISSDKILVATQMRGSVSFYNLDNNKEFKTAPYHNISITFICFSKNNKFITGSEDGTVELWLTNALKREYAKKVHCSVIKNIQISACSKFFATGSKDGTIILWDFENLSQTRLDANLSSLSSLYFEKDSSSLIICSAYKIFSYNLSTFINREIIATKAINYIDISSDLIFIAYALYKVYLFDIENKKVISKSGEINKNILCLKFSPNSDYLAVGCLSEEIIILAIPNLEEVRRYHSGLSRIDCLCFSKTNEFLGFSDGSTSVMIISTNTEQVYLKIEGFANSVMFCSNDKTFLYAEFNYVYVIVEDFTKLYKINFSHLICDLFLNEDERYVLASCNKRQWSILNVDSFEKLFENILFKDVKKWCICEKDEKCLTYISLV